MAKRHQRRPFPHELLTVPLVALSDDEWRAVDDMVGASLRSDGVVASYDRRSGRGTILAQDGRRFVFTAKRKYMRRGVGVSFIAGRTRAYYVRREGLVVIDGRERPEK